MVLEDVLILPASINLEDEDEDEEFDRCDEDEDYMPMPSSQPSTSQFGDEEGDMNAFRDNIANAIFANVN